MRVAVIGGGIAGLTAAWTISRGDPSAQVTVYDAAGAVGGKLRLGLLAGLPVDVGAEAMLVRRPEGVELVAELGLELVHPVTTSAAIRAGGSLHPVPRGTVMGVPGSSSAVADLLDADVLARIDAEPSLPPLPPLSGDVAVGALVADRLGGQVVDRLVEPLLAGVYAGRPARISLQAAVPVLARQLRDGGSLVRAVQASLPTATLTTPVFGSLRGGLGRLPQELVRQGSFDVETSATVRVLRRTGTSFELVLGAVPSPRTVTADVVVIAVPPPAAARLLADVAPAAAAELAGVELANVAIVSAAFTGIDVPAGSGLLVAPSEGLAVKGVTLTSQKWGGAPDGTTLLRMSIGRAGDTRDLQHDDASLTALALDDLRTLYGVTAAPVAATVTRWGGGLPQYDVGHTARVARIRAAVADVPGLGVCGAAYDGVGVPACIGSGRDVARSLVADTA